MGKDGPKGATGQRGLTGRAGPQGPQGPAGPNGPSSVYGSKNDLSRRESRMDVAAGSAASAIAYCERTSDLLIHGGCAAQPMWRVHLLSSLPIAAHNKNVKAGWQCDVRNTSADKSVFVTAVAYCASVRQ